MLKKSAKLVGCIAIMLIVAIMSVAGCSSGTSQTPSASNVQQLPSSSGTQSASQPAQPQSSGAQGQGQSPAAQDMTPVLKRAAEILGIASDKFITAFNNARPIPPTGQQGQPPAGQQGQPPAGQQGQQPAQGQQGQTGTTGQQSPPSGAPQMTDTYAKMATELNISADDIAKAMAQAMQELKK